MLVHVTVAVYRTAMFVCSCSYARNCTDSLAPVWFTVSGRSRILSNCNTNGNCGRSAVCCGMYCRRNYLGISMVWASELWN